MASDRNTLIQRLSDLGVSERDWFGMDEMAPEALELLLQSVEHHREMWVLPEAEHAEHHQHDHAPGEPHAEDEEHGSAALLGGSPPA
jgi:hypothetical protein